MRIDKKNPVVKILVRRDGMSVEDAIDLVKDTQSELLDAVYGTDILEAEEIIENNLGLEPDYLDFILQLQKLKVFLLDILTMVITLAVALFIPGILS